MFKEDFTAY